MYFKKYSQNMMLMLVLLLALIVIIALGVSMMICRKDDIKIGGKCHKMLDISGASDPRWDRKRDTSGNVSSTATNVTLQLKDPNANVKAVRVVGSIPSTKTAGKVLVKAGSTAATSDADANTALPINNNGQIHTIDNIFSTELAKPGFLTFTIPADMTVYEIQIV